MIKYLPGAEYSVAHHPDNVYWAEIVELQNTEAKSRF